jgi:trehalose 6-phosphate synthase/phosphatase
LLDLAKVSSARASTRGVRLSPLCESWPEDLRKKIGQATKLALVLDYDGTLVGLQKRPELALIALETLHLLEKMKSHFEICILSGRSADFLEQQFMGNSFLMGAEHGAFMKLPEGTWQSRVRSDLSSWYADVKRIMADYANRVPFSFVEEKTASVCWHYRESPEGFADSQSQKLHNELEIGVSNRAVSVLMGSKVVEVRAVECNKGDFIRWLQAQAQPGEFMICMGDDRTDEEMFRAVTEGGVSIKIGTESTVADYKLFHQEQVPMFLAELLSFVDERAAKQPKVLGKSESPVF